MIYESGKFDDNNLTQYKEHLKYVNKHYIKKSNFKWTNIDSFHDIKYDKINWDLDHVSYFFKFIVFFFI